MPTTLDNELVPAVQSLLDELGRSVTFTVADGGSTYDSTTGAGTKSTNDYTVKACPPYPYSFGMVNGDTVQAGDMKTLIAAEDLEFTPAAGQVVTWDTGDVWNVVNVMRIYSGESVCAWELGLRK